MRVARGGPDGPPFSFPPRPTNQDGAPCHEPHQPLAWGGLFLTRCGRGPQPPREAAGIPQQRPILAGRATRASTKNGRRSSPKTRRKKPAEGALSAQWRRTSSKRWPKPPTSAASAAQAHVTPAIAYKTRRDGTALPRAMVPGAARRLRASRTGTLHRLRVGTAQGRPEASTSPMRCELLALHKETIARERALQEDEDEDAILASLDAQDRGDAGTREGGGAAAGRNAGRSG